MTKVFTPLIKEVPAEALEVPKISATLKGTTILKFKNSTGNIYEVPQNSTFFLCSANISLAQNGAGAGFGYPSLLVYGSDSTILSCSTIGSIGGTNSASLSFVPPIRFEAGTILSFSGISGGNGEAICNIYGLVYSNSDIDKIKP